jgi:uncharacterized protein
MACVRCPTCQRDFDPERTTAMPFCSERCRLIDLGQWLDERYGLEHVPDEDEEEPQL